MLLPVERNQEALHLQRRAHCATVPHNIQFNNTFSVDFHVSNFMEPQNAGKKQRLGEDALSQVNS